jgi:hypothetical protein
MKRVFALYLLALLTLTGVGCATTGTQQPVNAYIPTFHYTPSTKEKPGSAGVTFAIVNAQYTAAGGWWVAYKQFETLPKAMGLDFQALLTAKGFTALGPFASYDEIPFPDKKSSDLLLIPTVELSWTEPENPKWELADGFGPQRPWIVTGKGEVNGYINLVLRESLTRELMWSKRIVISQYEVPYKVSVPAGPGPAVDFLRDYNAITNDLAKGIEQQYANLMATAEKYLDPEEMRLVKKQAQELKDKK